MSVAAIRVCNLRGIEDSELLNLKPINFMLGCNSAGKSTIARVFPLLKQSVESQTRGPILWYGRLVDFGDISSSVRKNASDRIISFTFCGDAKPSKTNSTLALYRFGFNIKPMRRVFDFKACIDLKEGDKKSTFANRYEISVFGYDVEVFFLDNGEVAKLIFNGEDALFFNELKSLGNRRGIYKTLAWVTEKGQKVSYLRKIIENITSCVHHKTSPVTIINIFSRLGPCSFSDFLIDIMKINEPNSWRAFVRNEENKFEIYKLWKLVQLLYFPDVLDSISVEIQKASLNVKYTRPLRASVERYYRSQDLAISEIDAEGKNLQVYLNSLSQRKRFAFQSWLENNFDISADSTYNEGHISITLYDKNSGDRFNMADMGFGFSQALPILTQLWEILYHCDEDDGTIFYIIEQPELHLHPKMQAKLMRVFASSIKIAKEKGIDLKIIAETHSEAIINKVGMLIRADELSAEDVAVYLFDRVDGRIKINQSSYSDKGALLDWPMGFFDY